MAIRAKAGERFTHAYGPRRHELKLANFEWNGETRPGVVRDGFVFEIPSASSVQEVIEKGILGQIGEEKLAQSKGIELDRVRLRAPLVSPDKILLAAVNYRAHGAEQKAIPPEEPYFFTKFKSCIVGNGDPILIPRSSKKVDWEAELAVVIGRKCKYVRRKDALEYVAGYTVANDVSYRDLQLPDKRPGSHNNFGPNWVKGKALDSAYPMGPWLVTRDEIADPQHLSLSLAVNGIERQTASTEDMVHSVVELIEYLSDGITLLPGDIISTGTPAGVAAFSGAPFLKEGDVVETTVNEIGTLVNPVKAEEEPK
jgi:2-keto-4-pentenoate hydratase/2-oxohepta-3-ene-1,7-dioic acid hydratase in catechol pathway